MKIYQEEKEEKSWALDLKDESDGDIVLIARDDKNGRQLANLIYFGASGRITPVVSAKRSLKKKGYNPHEHGNEFDENGAIIIKQRR